MMLSFKKGREGLLRCDRHPCLFDKQPDFPLFNHLSVVTTPNHVLVFFLRQHLVQFFFYSCMD